MANIIKSKGTSLLMSISAVYTAVPNLKSLSLTGEANTTFEAKLLDGNVFIQNLPDGYATPCTISAEVYYDPDDAVHAAFIALIAAPVATNFKITYVDATPLSAVYSGTGFGFDKTATPSDGLSGSMTILTSGAPTT